MNNKQLQLIKDYKQRIEPQLERKYNDILNQRMSEQADIIYPELTIYPKRWNRWIIDAMRYESPQSLSITNETYFMLFEPLSLDKAAIAIVALKKRSPIEMSMGTKDYKDYLEAIDNVERELNLLAQPMLEKLKSELLVERQAEFDNLVKDAERQIIGDDLKNGGKRIPLPMGA